MSQPVTPWIPGQAPVPGANYGRLSLPGVNDQQETEGRYGLGAPARPYGAPLPGTKYVIPDQVNLDAPVKPDEMKLDEQAEPNPHSPNVLPETHKVTGFRVTDPKGNVVADFADNPNAGAGNDYVRAQVQKIGESLTANAVNDEDKAAAKRATDFGMSLVGLMPMKDIQAAVVHRYDTDERNGITRSIQEQKNKRAQARMGGGGPAGPTKADKFQNQLDGELRKNVDNVIESERRGSKYAAISDQENNIAQMDQLLAAPNAMGQRVAVQRALLELTGKASRESEQAALTGAAGKWEELKNKLSLWTSDDPQLSRQYIAEFRAMLAVQRRYIAEQKAKIADAAAQRAYAESFGYPDDQRQMAYSIVKGAMTGNFEGPAAYRSQQSGAASSAPAPNGGSAVSPHLQKYLK